MSKKRIAKKTRSVKTQKASKAQRYFLRVDARGREYVIDEMTGKRAARAKYDAQLAKPKRIPRNKKKPAVKRASKKAPKPKKPRKPRPTKAEKEQEVASQWLPFEYVENPDSFPFAEYEVSEPEARQLLEEHLKYGFDNDYYDFFKQYKRRLYAEAIIRHKAMGKDFKDVQADAFFEIGQALFDWLVDIGFDPEEAKKMIKLS